MAKRTPENESVPSQLKVARDAASEKIAKQIAAGVDLQQQVGTIRTDEGKAQYRNAYETWDEYNSSLLKTLFTGTEVQAEYDEMLMGGFRMNASLGERIGYVKRDVDEKLRRLESLRGRLDLFDGPAASSALAAPTKSAGPRTSSRNVFIVHGHDGASKEAIARFLSKLDLNPIILHEQPNGGKTVIEKFEANADVSFAVVLMTPDDEANAIASPQAKERRARQNVVLELGYFIGRLGRMHVAALKEASVAVPSDISGVLYIDLDAGGAWKLSLAKEIKNAGLDVDMNRAV